MGKSMRIYTVIKIMPDIIRSMAKYCWMCNFSLYTSLPYTVATTGFAKVRAATMLTFWLFIPRLKNNVPNAPKNATKNMYPNIFLFDNEKPVLEINR